MSDAIANAIAASDGDNWKKTAALLNEKAALRQAIGTGLGEAASGCGVDTSAISILEQGSGQPGQALERRNRVRLAN